MRRNQVMIATEFPSELNGLFKNLETKGNPWGMNASGRNDWISEVDFDVRVFGMDGEDAIPDDVDYLFWVGCAGAFEDRAKRTTKAVAELLTIAGVQFMVLGEGETCTGDPARRAGNEFLFQMQAMQNVEVLNEIKATKIVVTCPHCLNTLKREYPQLGGNYEVVHHTQLLNDLVKAGRLTPVAPGRADGHVPRPLLPRPSQQRLRPAARAHRGHGRDLRRDGAARRQVLLLRRRRRTHVDGGEDRHPGQPEPGRRGDRHRRRRRSPSRARSAR